MQLPTMLSSSKLLMEEMYMLTFTVTGPPMERSENTLSSIINRTKRNLRCDTFFRNTFNKKKTAKKFSKLFVYGSR